MKKTILIFLSVLMLITVSSCSDTIETLDPENSFIQEANATSPLLSSVFENAGMPVPFSSTQNGGGNFQLIRFTVPTFSDLTDAINRFPRFLVEPFMEMDDFYNWVNSYEMNRYFNEPQTSLMGYPNMYSYVITFNISIDELREVMKQNQAMAKDLAEEADIYYHSDEEIEIICSLDETRIMEYFVSDESIFIEGKLYPPLWLYLHDSEDYEKVGITTDMISEKLELYSEFNFTAEATEAFENKLSAFMGEEITLDRTARSDNLS